MPELRENRPLLVSRSEARRQGATRYFTGKPCKNGHVALRAVANGVCLDCSKVIQARHRRANRPAIAARERAYWSTRVEQRRAKSQRCAARATDAQRARAADRKRTYYERNRLLCIQRTADWRVANPQRHKVNVRRYALRHPEQLTAKDFRRRQRKLVGTGDRVALAAALRHLRTRPSLPCYWCQVETTLSSRHIDHIIPLGQGGAHAAGNLCAACASCNQRRGAKLPETFSGQSEMAFR